MQSLKYDNLEFLRFNNNGNNEIAVITHGGYTPRSGRFHPGSGKSTVPTGIALHFYAPQDTVCVGTAAYWKVSTGVCNNPIAETVNALGQTENYSLVHDEKLDTWNFNDTWTMDIVLVRKKKAHLNDIWKGIAKYGLPYTNIHCFFCRINKATYTDQVG